MAENTHMKSMENSIADMHKTLQKFLEDSDRRHNEYMQSCHWIKLDLNGLKISLAPFM